MDEKDSQLSSDDSDADYLPKEEDYKSDSGSEVSDNESSEGEDKTSRRRKRKRETKKSSKKIKTSKTDDEENEEEEKNEENEVDKKFDIDALWADFKKDVNNKDIKKTVEPAKSQPEIENSKNDSSQGSSNKKIAAVNARGIPCFSNRNKVSGLSKIVNQIGKKDKMSTLQKSQLDWNNFKKSEGIEEEIKTYNKGKDGYLEKQDFLQRTDLRQFEIEKDLRSVRRKF